MISRSLPFLCFVFLIFLPFAQAELAAQDSESAESITPACEPKANVDTCWKKGFAIEESDPAGALKHFEMSCNAFRNNASPNSPFINLDGCYRAGKIYLHNAELKNSHRAYQLFGTVCNSTDAALGPYGCKFLGWMHHTGIGAKNDPEAALHYLQLACFLHNDLIFIDAEGCQFLSEHILANRSYDQPEYMAYLALSMGCTDGAEDLCAAAVDIYSSAQNASPDGIADCNARLERDPVADSFSCGAIPFYHDFEMGSSEAYQLQQKLRLILRAAFLRGMPCRFECSD